jgi:hypothetical protein
MKVLLKHGTANDIANYVGVKGELVLNESTSMVNIIDGVKPGGHPIDGATYTVDIPSIIAPVEASISVSRTPVLQSNAYTGNGAHYSSKWQIATDDLFANIVYDSGADTVGLIQHSVVSPLAGATVLYARVKHTSILGVSSQWSEGVSFTTVPVLPENLLDTKTVAGFSDFGVYISVSADGSTAVMGLPGNTTGNGEVKVYNKTGSTWTEVITLTIPGTDDLFGGSVAISPDGNTIVVGDGYDSTNGANAGKAYVFTKVGGFWTQSQALLPNDGAASNRFGKSIAMSTDGSTLAIGALNGIYVFTKSGGTYSQSQKLTGGSNGFGTAIAMSDDATTIVGGDNLAGVNSAGQALVFTNSGGTYSQTQVLTASDSESWIEFGFAVAISGDGTTIAIGVPKADASTAGAVYMFTVSGGTWSEVQKLYATDTAVDSSFGNSVSLSVTGDTLAVGSFRDDDNGGNGTNSGSAYLFTKAGGTWGQNAMLYPVDPSTNVEYGTSVKISGNGNFLFVGTYAVSSVYIYG